MTLMHALFGREDYRHRLFLFLILSMHLAGVIGLLSPVRGFFLTFTPLHLLATTAILLHRQWSDRRYLLAAGLVAVFTFFVEVAGVQTGLIFGAYQYGATLGPKVGGTPLLIGINWVLLSFTIAHIKGGMQYPLVAKAAVSALLMTGLDYFIEPVAMAYDFWNWTEGDIPLQNYLGWYVVSFLVFLGLYRWVRFDAHPLAKWIWWAQVGFFLSLNYLGG